MLFYFCMRGCGRIARPAFPAPSGLGRKIHASLGRTASRECGGVPHVRSPCLVRNCAREQGPPRERNALIATPQALAVARKSLNSVSPTTDTEYGFLLSQERRRTVRREIAELCVCNYHRRHCADCNRIAGLHPS